MFLIKNILYLILLMVSTTKGTPALSLSKDDIKTESPLTAKSSKYDWKIGNHEKAINQIGLGYNLCSF